MLLIKSQSNKMKTLVGETCRIYRISTLNIGTRYDGMMV